MWIILQEEGPGFSNNKMALKKERWNSQILSLKKCILIKCNELDSQVEQTCKKDIFRQLGKWEY